MDKDFINLDLVAKPYKMFIAKKKRSKGLFYYLARSYYNFIKGILNFFINKRGCF